MSLEGYDQRSLLCYPLRHLEIVTEGVFLCYSWAEFDRATERPDVTSAVLTEPGGRE